MVVDIHQRLVFVRIGQVMQVVVCIFRIGKQAVPLCKVLLECTLSKEIRIPLAILVRELVADDCPRISTFRVVQVSLRLPVSLLELSEQPSFHTQGIQVTVLPHRRRIISLLHAVSKLVFSRRVKILGTERTADSLSELLFPQYGWIYHTKRARLERSPYVILLSFLELRRPCLQIDGARRAEILCRLENGTLLSVVQRDRLHVVERESSQIDRTVLCVSQLDAVVEHTYMVGSHTPDIHRFQSPYSSVVLDLYAGKIAQGISHVVRAELMELLAR